MKLTTEIRRIFLTLSTFPLVFAAILLMLGAFNKAEGAAYANYGAGKYKDIILWMTWGDSSANSPGVHDRPLVIGSVSRAAHPLPSNKTLNVTCTITSVSNRSSTSTPNSQSIKSYRPGTYFLDALQDLYARSGRLSANTLISGITNTHDGQRVEFNVGCSVDVDGQAINIPGLIVADAEVLASDWDYEHIKATALGSWHIIDFIRGPSATGNYEIQKNPATGGKQTIMFSNGTDNLTGAVSFLKLTTPSSNVNFEFSLKGGGHSALALGLLIPYADFGDAPQSYGNAYHLIQDVATKPDGIAINTRVDLMQTAQTPHQYGFLPAFDNFLGTVGPDAESDANEAFNHSVDANGDDLNGFAGPNEEDAWKLTQLPVHRAGQTLTQTIRCSGTGWVAGWIDFNINGTFDTNERSNTSRCTSGNATLIWSIPYFPTLKAGKSYVRLRIASDTTELAQPTGLASDGEVEDHVLTITAPNLSLVKTSNAGSLGWYKGQSNATISLTVTNNGNIGTREPSVTILPAISYLGDIVVYDVLPTGLKPNWTGTYTSGSFSCTYLAQKITCVRATNLPPSTSATITLPITVTAETNGSLTNYASVGSGFDPYNGGSTPEPNTCTPASNVHCASNAIVINNPFVKVVKTASPGTTTRLFLGDAVTYTLTVSVTNASLVSDLVLTDVLPAGLTFEQVTNNLSGFTDNFASNNTFVLPASPEKSIGSYSISFRARVNQDASFKGNLINKVTATGGSPVTPDCSACTTSHPVSISQLRLTKSATGTKLDDVNDILTFSFLLENLGDNPLSTIQIFDPFLTSAGITVPPVATLAAGDYTVVTVPYALKVSDFTVNKVENTASASGTDAYTRPVISNNSTTLTPLPQSPSLTVVKTASTPTGQTPGSTITYSFAVKNTGNSTLSNVTVNDPLLSGAGVTIASIPTLAVGDTQTVSATYTLTAADFGTGRVENSATASGSPPSGAPVTSPPSTTTTPLTKNPALTLAKTASAPTGNAIGDTITYSFAVTNTGNVDLSNVTITDPLLSAAGVTIASIPTLEVGDTQSVSATYTLTAADFGAEKVDNSATASGSSPSGAPVTSLPSTTTTPLTKNPALTLLKTASAPTGQAAGSTLNYSFAITNTGNVTLTNVTVNDPLLSSVGTTIASIPTLAVGDTQIVTATYTLTAADFGAEKVDNSATASGSPPSGAPVTSLPSTTTTPLTKNPALGLLKTVSAPTGQTPGSTLTYSFRVRNIGNVDLTNVTINDPLLIAAGVTIAPIPTLTVGQIQTVTATYSLTAADFGAEKVDNSATASGTPPGGGTVTSPPSTTTTPLVKNPSFTFVKTASAPSGQTVGSTITYSFEVTNTGNVDLSNVTITDPLLSAAGVTIASIPTLKVNDTQSVSASYSLTAADFSAGKVDNSATASGTPPGGSALTSPPSSTTTPLTQSPALTLVKTASAPSGQTVGSTITYSFEVTNTGNLDLTNVTVTDPLLSAAGLTIASIPTLAVGEKKIVSATYSLTAADFTLGKVDNSATASGTPPGGGTTTSPPSTTTTPLTQSPALTLVKTASAPSGQTVGSTITYSFEVTNTGNLDLTNVNVNDPLLSAAGLTIASIPTLAVGEKKIVSATYSLTAADFNAGKVDNSATASGTPPGGGTTTSPPSTATTSLTQNPALTLVKTASVPTGNAIGDTITYSFEVTNTGNVALTNVTVTDPLLSAAGLTIASIPTLAVGEKQIVSATYSLTAADFNAGKVDNSATASGTPPGGGTTTSPPSTATTSLTQSPALTLVKTASVPTGNAIGDTITYSFEVTNTGNVALTNVTVTDPLLSAAGLTIASIPTLAVGEKQIVSATYSLTAADFNAGKVDNSATASGTPPAGGTTISSPSTTTTQLVQKPSFSFVKKASAPSAQTVGSTITYSFEVTNTGNVDLTNITVTDPLLSAAGVTIPVLAELLIGQTKTTQADYVLTQADIDAGEVINHATAIAEDPKKQPNPPESSQTITPLEPVSSLLLTKTISQQSGINPGDTITYRFDVTNTGVTRLQNVVIDDALLTNARVVISPIGTLEPNETKSVSAIYTITLSDIQAGIIDNIALARGATLLNKPVVSNTAEVRAFLTQHPEILIKKRANAPVTDKVGDLVEYIFDVKNTGNVLMSNITIDDPMLKAAGISIPPVGDLAPGESRTVVAIYTLVEPDFERGYVENIATAKAKKPNNEEYTSPPSEKVIYLTPTPLFTVTKTLYAGPSPVTETGQVLTFAIEVKNIGNMNLAGITITDLLDGAALDVGQPQGDTLNPGILDVDETWLYLVFYTVTQLDMDTKSQLTNTVTVRSTTIGSNTPPPAVVTVPVLVRPINAQDSEYIIDLYDILDETNLGNALENDTFNNQAADLTNVSLAILTPIPIDGSVVPYVDGRTGSIIFPQNTPAGTYVIRYRICELHNPSNCAEAVVRITAFGPAISAQDDDYGIRQSGDTSPLGNVLDNDTLNNRATSIAAVSIEVESSSHPHLRLDTQTGLATLEAFAAPGDYELSYKICSVRMLTLCARAKVTVKVEGENYIRLMKQAMTSTAKIGDIVRYTLTGKNISAGAIENFELVDNPPAGFSYVENSIRIADRDGQALLTQQSPLVIQGISIAAEGEFTITYALRVGPGAAVVGEYTNKAVAQKNGKTVSNTATATIMRTADPMFEETRIWGSVFHDVDGNSWQAQAIATGLHAQGGFNPSVYVPQSTYKNLGQGPLALPDASAPLLRGLNVGTLHEAESIVIGQRLTAASFTDDFVLTSQEGTSITLNSQGQSRTTLKDEVKNKRNVQKLNVSRVVFPSHDQQILVEYHITNAGTNERGLPGVRLGTVEGLLTTTDAYGRYHIEGITVDHIGRGKNFVVKVDPSTLPEQAQMSTPNPLLLRITQGLPARFDFGVKFKQPSTAPATFAEVDLSKSIFNNQNSELTEESKTSLEALSVYIQKHKQVKIHLHQTSDMDVVALFKLGSQIDDFLQTKLDDGSMVVLQLNNSEGQSLALIQKSRLTFYQSGAENRLHQALLAQFIERAGLQNPVYLEIYKNPLATTTIGYPEAKALFDALTSQLPRSDAFNLRIYSDYHSMEKTEQTLEAGK